MNAPDPAPETPPPFDPSAYRTLDDRDRLSTLSWYLVATGVIALILAALCLILDRTGNRDFFAHKDFSLNPRVLGRWLLFVGLIAYALGRALSYWRRFSKRDRD